LIIVNQLFVDSQSRPDVRATPRTCSRSSPGIGMRWLSRQRKLGQWSIDSETGEQTLSTVVFRTGSVDSCAALVYWRWFRDPSKNEQTATE
jgi:hypothetical protein